MNTIESFAAVARVDARVLVLGSMPGERSLRDNEYYAHPRNRFWDIMAQLVGIDRSVPYHERIAGLSDCGIALWDVLSRCQRSGSLDSAIREPQVNDFRAFLHDHPSIQAVFFNGGKAESLWQRLVIPRVPATLLPAHQVRLPSTSPAYAAMSFEDKLAAWQQLLAYVTA
ncbi:MAG: DNA-deoxyinosine glycosylase [Gammaproteobacteria bacterium]|nr:DNA-deoxyinosine glycosylase [Gammaproteobacteria bacterium]